MIFLHQTRPLCGCSYTWVWCYIAELIQGTTCPRKHSFAGVTMSSLASFVSTRDPPQALSREVQAGI